MHIRNVNHLRNRTLNFYLGSPTHIAQAATEWTHADGAILTVAVVCLCALFLGVGLVIMALAWRGLPRLLGYRPPSTKPSPTHSMYSFQAEAESHPAAHVNKAYVHSDFSCDA